MAGISLLLARRIFMTISGFNLLRHSLNRIVADARLFLAHFSDARTAPQNVTSGHQAALNALRERLELR